MFVPAFRQAFPVVIVQSAGLVNLFTQDPDPLSVHKGALIAPLRQTPLSVVHNGAFVAPFIQSLPVFIVHKGGFVAPFIH